MPTPSPLLTPLRLVGLVVLIVTFVIASFAGGRSSDPTGHHGDGLRDAQQPASSLQPVGAEPTGTTGPASMPLPTLAPEVDSIAKPTSSPVEASHPVATTPEELLLYQPNELGVVPVLEYHVITTNPEEEEQFVRTADDMRADLQWLNEHNFYIVPLRDVVANTIAVPAGKHPVALTFDDGTSTQFAFIENEQGELVPDPNTAIGILEEFSNAHPDFGRGGHFGFLIFNAFAEPDQSQRAYFEAKIQWLVDHGYEIGNHTWQHTNLANIGNNEFVMTVAEPILWANEMLGDQPANASEILTLPYGSIPDGELHPDQRQAMRRGFMYEGQRFRITAALLVGAEPAHSPASTEWNPMGIPRIQMFHESVEFWFGQFDSGGVILYTSDGYPSTIAVPNPLPSVLEGQLDEAALADAGKQVIHYDAATGQTNRPQQP